MPELFHVPGQLMPNSLKTQALKRGCVPLPQNRDPLYPVGDFGFHGNWSPLGSESDLTAGHGGAGLCSSPAEEGTPRPSATENSRPVFQNQGVKYLANSLKTQSEALM